MDFGGRWFFLYELKEEILRYKIAQYCFSALVYMQAKCALCKKNFFGAFSSALRIEREFSVIDKKAVPMWVHKAIQSFDSDEKSWSQFVKSYRKTNLSHAHQKKYSSFPLSDHLRIRQPKVNPPPERQGDLMVLKPYIGVREKGVLFLNFDETVDKFFSLYDVEKIAQDYRLVLEPSAWGYQQPRMFLLRGLQTNVVVESQYKPDYDYIDGLGGALLPIRLGAGDWVDPELFCPEHKGEKTYDLVMIANWLKWKRHKLLFTALKELGNDIGRVALIGYPIEGRTSTEVLALAQKIGVDGKIDIYENISAAKVSSIIRKSSVGIMLSKKEGANRGIYECFFSDVPVILTSRNIGVNRDHLNQHTGMLADDCYLSKVIRIMLNKTKSYHTRDWALANTGWENSSVYLNDFLRTIALESQENWTCDIFPKMNAPLPCYTTEENRVAADCEVERLSKYLL